MKMDLMEKCNTTDDSDDSDWDVSQRGGASRLTH
jgi:hypothetical protein